MPGVFELRGRVFVYMGYYKCIVMQPLELNTWSRFKVDVYQGRINVYKNSKLVCQRTNVKQMDRTMANFYLGMYFKIT